MGAVLAVREFRALWLAEAVSVAGDQLAKVALALTVYNRTGSALWTAVVYALSFLPALAGGLGLAYLADLYPRRTVMMTGATAQAVFVAVMALPGMPLAAMCALLIGVGVAQAPALAAQNALTREVFTQDEPYYRSQDLRGITTNTVMLLGLAGAGLLVDAVGSSTALFIDAATFAVAAVLVRVFAHHRPVPVTGRGRGSWSAGMRYVWREPRLRLLLWLSWVVGLAVVPEGLAAPLAAQFGAPPGAVGWLLAADPLGYVVGAFVLSRFVPTALRQRWVGVLATVSVAILLLFALAPASSAGCPTRSAAAPAGGPGSGRGGGWCPGRGDRHGHGSRRDRGRDRSGGGRSGDVPLESAVPWKATRDTRRVNTRPRTAPGGTKRRPPAIWGTATGQRRPVPLWTGVIGREGRRDHGDPESRSTTVHIGCLGPGPRLDQ